MSPGQILMSVAIAQYGVIPLIADLNASHATNSDWPPHARFHAVAQVMTSSLAAAVAMTVLWLPGLDLAFRANTAAAVSACVLVGFFLSVAFSRTYGGAISAPGAARVAGLDGNIVNFGIAAILLTAGRLLIGV